MGFFYYHWFCNDCHYKQFVSLEYVFTVHWCFLPGCFFGLRAGDLVCQESVKGRGVREVHWHRPAAAGLAPAYSFSAYVAEVDVDIETGLIKCTDVWAAHDCGKALNPLAVEGQIIGSCRSIAESGHSTRAVKSAHRPCDCGAIKGVRRNQPLHAIGQKFSLELQIRSAARSSELPGGQSHSGRLSVTDLQSHAGKNNPKKENPQPQVT